MAKRPVTASEAVAKSNAKRGAVPVGLRLLPDELAILDQMADRLGGRKAAIMAGLDALKKRNDLTQDQVLDWIKRNTK